MKLKNVYKLKKKKKDWLIMEKKKMSDEVFNRLISEEVERLYYNVDEYDASSLTIDQLESYKTAFSMYDKNCEGSISTNELLTVMRNLGENPTEEDIQVICDEVDLKKSGKIDYIDFVQHMMKRHEKHDSIEDLRNAFGVFDTNGDGKINVEELKFVMTNLGNVMSIKEVEEMMKEADRDKNGYIDYEEFVKMISEQLK